MFPCSTNHFSFTSKWSEAELKEYLVKCIERKRIFQITYDNTFYGTVKEKIAYLELGQTPTRNSFRPQTIIKWQSDSNGLQINGFYRPHLIVTIFFLIIPLAGAKIGLENKSVLPFITTIILWIILYFGIIQLVYNSSKKRTFDKVEELLNNIKK